MHSIDDANKLRSITMVFNNYNKHTFEMEQNNDDDDDDNKM